MLCFITGVELFQTCILYFLVCMGDEWKVREVQMGSLLGHLCRLIVAKRKCQLWKR